MINITIEDILNLPAHILVFSVLGIILYLYILDYFMETCFTYHILNPISNYKNVKNLNWFGVTVITLLLNIVLFPIAIGYWGWMIIYKLFTIGRKSEDEE